MNASLIARLASLLLVLTLLLPALGAVAAPSTRGRYNKGGLHRPVYKKYQPGTRWVFQKR